MVAFNYQAQFADKVSSNQKRQTIRKYGKRKPPKVGAELQHFTGQRTKYCRLLRRSMCKCVADVLIDFGFEGRFLSLTIAYHGGISTVLHNFNLYAAEELTNFAIADGFEGLDDFYDWFKSQADEHALFVGYLVMWD